MKWKHSKRNLFLISLFFISFGCAHKPEKGNEKRVSIKFQNNKYILFRNGKPFFVKGGAGYTNLKSLKYAGGNTIRVWDTVNLKVILDSAQFYGLAVMVGLPMPDNSDLDLFYNNNKAVACHFANLSAVVNKYKNHPALLCWCIGNELPFPYKPQYHSFYSAFNNIVDMIHHDDPDHPVTTTMIDFQKKNIINIKLRTNIDFISFNIFGAIQNLNTDLANFAWFWKGPFLISEWGCEGPWTTYEQNAWGAYAENTSLKKAEQYLDLYKKYMPVNNPEFLGSLVFYWGQKQELTPTWFSLFDENGRKTEVVNTMQYIWTGKMPAIHAPPIKFMLINDKGGMDNLLFAPGQITRGKVYMLSDTGHYSYRWKLLNEDWYKVNGIFSEKKLASIGTLDTTSEIQFKTPVKEGPYRLYVAVYNKYGYLSTCNIPFYVVHNP